MVGRDITVNVEYETQRQALGGVLRSQVEYVLVASKDITVNHVDFKKGELKKMTGLLARNCIKNSGGVVKVYNPEEEKAIQEKAELEQLKADLEELKKEKSRSRTKKSE